jgi:hypothetical protein
MAYMELPIPAESTANGEQRACDFLVDHPAHFQTFRTFFNMYCNPMTSSDPSRLGLNDENITYDEILSRGIADDTNQIFATRQAPGDAFDPNNYLVMQFDIQQARTYEHKVIHIDNRGAGDRFERILTMARFSLCLSGSGSYITQDTSIHPLGDVLLLPYKVDYLRAKREKILAAQTISIAA